jgi:hypothetical protein
VNRKCSARFARYFNLAAGDQAVAQHANSLVVERMPFSAEIVRLENRKLVVWKEHWVDVGRSAIKATRQAAWNPREI